MTRILVSLLVLTVSTIEAEPPDSTQEDTTVVVDTVLYQPGDLLSAYSPVTNPVNLEQRLYQNPTVALFKSMLVPGLGQLGNRRYFKAALFFGLDAWFVGSAIHYGRQAADFRSRYESDTTIAGRNAWFSLYDDRRDQRNKFTWFAVIVTFISMFDAYVDAHLSGFPQATQNSAVSFEVQPYREAGMAATVSISF
jgi:hypothetical protein